MILMTNVIYPPESAKEIARRYLTAPVLPDFLVKRGPYISADLKNGINSITFYELDNARLAEGIQVLGDNMAVYIGVPGYRYDIKPYYELEEGLKMIGM
ncbi:conserved hypothetical protein [Desulfamplus magnetovallimortis]|uniref:Uncharacterized protein n=1 Tax=Desulfamplus magnetovallimortis TaxID=1246637 RepID=A0A1W1HHA2_9BACT|nr:hypothetical protein [Desulfamplus magnetovallimortis]SLM31795.1 conserved hypothetical protein [Desulfamplus magnetovallimortis]